MKIVVGYDSNYGNTQRIAEVIGDVLGVKPLNLSDLDQEKLKDTKIFVLGSPIIGWKPSEKTQEFLNLLESGSLNGVKITTFDTRVRIFFHGDAAKKMARSLEKLGGVTIIEPEYFYVGGTEGPLLADEIKRATSWAQQIKKAFSRQS